jgi:two-component system, NtrC family, sensor histidine kinase PilS
VPLSNTPAANANLTVRVVWLTAFRTLGTTALLIALALQVWSKGPTEAIASRDISAFIVIGIVYLLTIVTGILARSNLLNQASAWLQVVFDTVLASSVVALTGGLDSPLGLTYALATIGSGLLFGRTGAVVGFIFSMSAFVITALLATPTSRTVSQSLSEIGTQAFAQFLIAILSGYLAEQLLRTGGQLSAREQDLRQLTSLQNQIVNAMPSGLITCDSNFKVTYVNPAAQSILGLESSAAGSDIELHLPGFQKLKGIKRGELRVASARGERILGLSLTSLDAQDEATLAVFQDLTELRRLEGELERIDRFASLGKVSAQLAHEIRNPLASIRGSAQLVQSDVPAGSDSERMVSLIVKEADRLAELVEGYLKLARPPPPTKSLQRIDLLAKETLEMLRTDVDLMHVSLDLRFFPVEVWVDAGQFKQIFLNLLRNAIAATKGQGPVRISIHEVDTVPVLEVWDAAGSIPKQHLGRIFEPFFTTTNQGTGLGLSTVQSIVQAHGANISVTSNPSDGTTFRIAFPLKSERASL